MKSEANGGTVEATCVSLEGIFQLQTKLSHNKPVCPKDDENFKVIIANIFVY